jgi:MHS family proline/betaine transporter-like MFS transporter
MAEMEMPVAGAQASADSKRMVNAIIASVLGWALDLFDVFILQGPERLIRGWHFPSAFSNRFNAGDRVRRPLLQPCAAVE